MKAAGACFGWQVRSEVPLLFTRPGAADDLPVLEVGEADVEPASAADELVLSWTPTERNPVRAELYRCAGSDSWRVCVDGGGWYLVEPSLPRIQVPRDAEPVRREERLWGLPSLLCLLRRPELPLHSAALAHDGHAVLVAGPSRAGKTTLAGYALSQGWRLLSEDLSFVRLGTGTPTAHVHPGPAALRIRSDMTEDLSLDRHQGWDLGDGRRHLAVHPDDRGDGRPVPVSAIVLLHPGERLQVAPEPPEAALRDLWALSFRIPETADRVRCFEQLATLVSQVPLLRLQRPVTAADLPQTLDLLLEASRG